VGQNPSINNFPKRKKMIKNTQKKCTKVKNKPLVNANLNNQKLTKDNKSSLTDNKSFHRSLEAFSDCV
jgi:hypothetical protein